MLDELIRLQEKDSEIARLRQAQERLQLQIQETRENLEANQTHLQTLKAATKQTQVAHKEKELELADQEAKVRKHQQELNRIKSNAAFKALLLEIDREKGLQSQKEDEILELLEDLDRSEKEAREESNRLLKLQAESDQKIRSLQEEQKQIEAQIAQQMEVRGDLIQRIAPPLLQRYERLRERLHGVAVVPAQGDSCGGCQMALTPNLLIEIQKEKQLVFCERCQRILYPESKDPQNDAHHPRGRGR